MKKLALISLILLTALVACKKKSVKPKQDNPAPKELITRINWHTIHIQHYFYDQDNNRVYKTPDSAGVAYKFQNDQIQITNLDNTIKQGTYSITKSNAGGQLLNLTFNNHTDTFNIDTLTESLLYFHGEKANAVYIDNGVQHNAAKEVTSVYLHCDCGQ